MDKHPTIPAYQPVEINYDAEIPQRIAHFRVIRQLGHGTMGRVLLGEDGALKRHVALKVSHYQADADDKARARQRQFVSEARAIASLIHPSVVQVYEVGIDNDRLFIAMEFLPGGDLRSLVSRRGPLDWRRAVGYAIEAAGGLSCAHQHGICHRDIKPANLLLDENGHCKITDFGLSLRIDRPGKSASPWKVAGSPLFMAPEMARGTGSTSSDIFALGATLFYLITGRAPFRVRRLTDVIQVHRKLPLPDLRKLMPELPHALVDVIERSLAYYPQERFVTAESFAGALQMVLEKDKGTGSQGPAWKLWAAGGVLLLAAGAVSVATLIGPASSGDPPEADPRASVTSNPETRATTDRVIATDPVTPADQPTVEVDGGLTQVIEPPRVASRETIVPEADIPESVTPIETPAVEPAIVEVNDIHVSDRVRLALAADSNQTIRLVGRVERVGYALDTDPRTATLYFAGVAPSDAPRVVVEGRLFAAMTRKFGGKRGDGITDQSIRVEAPITHRPDGGFALAVSTTRQITAIDAATVDAAKRSVSPDQAVIDATDTDRLSALVRDGNTNAHDVVGQVRAEPVVRQDGRVVIRLQGGAGLVLMCEAQVVGELENRYGERAVGLNGLRVHARGVISQPAGRAMQLRVTDADHLYPVSP